MILRDEFEFVYGEIFMKRRKGIVIISILLLITVFILIGLCIRNMRLCRAEHYGDTFQIDGKVYEEISYIEIEPYNETWKVVCKTTDGAWTIYEIEQYPEHEYLVARTAWEARVLKQVE